MSNKLKNAPKTALLKAVKSLKNEAHISNDRALEFLCNFVQLNYSDCIAEWNEAEDEDARSWIKSQGLKHLYDKVDKASVEGAIAGASLVSPISEVKEELLTVLGIAAFAHIDDDLISAYKEQEEKKRANDPSARQSLAELRLINELLPGLCTNTIDQSIWMTDTKTNELRRLTSNELEFPDILIAEEHGYGISRMGAISAIRYQSNKEEFNPARDMILECAEERGSQFPDTESSDAFLMSIAKVLYDCDEPVAQKGFAQALVCLVQGVMDRRAKPLMYAPTLVGPGGCAKSRSIACLVPEKWRHLLFKAITVSPNKLFNDLTQLSVAWIQELPEVDRYIRNQFAEDFKAIMTAESNSFRAPYARIAEDHKRIAGFFGTSNKEGQILTDNTSACDRRILPIRIQSGHRIPWQKLEQGLNKDIWAAALQSYQYPKVFNYYLSELPFETYEELGRLQQDFREADPYEDRLEWELSISNTIYPQHFLADCVDKPVSQQATDDIRRVNGLMRTLHSDEWVQKKIKLHKDSKRINAWIRKTAIPQLDFIANLQAYKTQGFTPRRHKYLNQPDPFSLDQVPDASTDF